MKVFISYNHKDRELASRIREILEQSAIESLIDQDTLGFSDSIDEFMERWRECTHFIAIFSKNYFDSGYCLFELTQAYDTTDKVMIAVTEDTSVWCRSTLEESKRTLHSRKRRIKSLANRFIEKLKASFGSSKTFLRELERIDFVLSRLHLVENSLNLVTLMNADNLVAGNDNLLIRQLGDNALDKLDELAVLEKCVLVYNASNFDPIPPNSNIDYKGSDDYRYNLNRLQRIEELYITHPKNSRINNLKAMYFEKKGMTKLMNYFHTSQ
jgi:hypothetical protein